MRYRMLVVLASVVMLLPRVMAAQDEETWYFAWKPETGEVVAYTAAGVVNTILEDVRAYRLLRLDERTELLVAGVDGLFVLYKLMPDGVQRFTTEFNERRMVEEEIRIGAFIIPAIRLPYLLMTFNNAQYVPELLLIDVDEGVVARLDTELLDTVSYMCDVALYEHSLDECVRFSEDLQSVRYIAIPENDEDSAIWTLRERSLSTGEERVIYTYSDPAPDTAFDRTYCEPDRYGEQWICKTGIDYERGQFTEFWILHSSGDRESIKVVNNLPDWQWHIFFADDNLITVENLCESDCQIEVQSPDDTSLIFPLPSDYSLRTLPINDVTLIDDERMLIFTGNERFILSREGILTNLGSAFCCHSPEPISDDGQWLYTYGDDTFRVWNVFNEEMLLEIDAELGNVGIHHRDNGFFIRGYPNRQAESYHHLLYLYSDQTTVELPEMVDGIYFEILPDNELLFEQMETYQNQLEGIYRYSLEGDEFTLLVPGGDNPYFRAIGSNPNQGILMPDERKTLALIAHDGKKADMVAFTLSHKDVLERYEVGLNPVPQQSL